MPAAVALGPSPRILVVRLATLGDLLTITPALRALRHTYPAAHVAVLTTPASSAALRGLDSVDEVLPFDKVAFDRPRDALMRVPSAMAFGSRLRKRRWDALALLHHLTTPFGLAKYAALALASGAPVRAGLENGRGRAFLTHGAADHGFGWRHEADYALDVAHLLGARHPGAPRLELVVDANAEAWARGEWGRVAGGDQGAILVPGGGGFSLARRWPAERFSEVGRMVEKRHGLRIAVLAGVASEEQALARRVAAEIPGAGVLAPAPSPAALGALIGRAAVLIGNDSGPIHVACAVDTPVVAIFGPTNHAAWGPYPVGLPRHQVVREQVVCAPCIHRGHVFGTPAGCAARTCLALVESQQVAASVARALDTSRVAGPALSGRVAA